MVVDLPRERPHCLSHRRRKQIWSISAQGFWDNRYQRAFFDVRVFNPNSGFVRLNWVHSLPSCSQPLVEWRSLPPWPTNGLHPCWQGSETNHTALWQPGYVAIWAFFTREVAITCLWGARSSSGHAAHNGPVDLAVSEGQVPLEKLWTKSFFTQLFSTAYFYFSLCSLFYIWYCIFSSMLCRA